MGAASVRRPRSRSLRGVLFPGLPVPFRSVFRLPVHLAGGVLERSDDGGGLGGLPGHWPALRGHRRRLHEFHRQPRRRRGRQGDGVYHPADAAGAGVAVDQLTAEQRNTAELLGYKINFFMFGVAYLIAVALWLYFDSTKP